MASDIEEYGDSARNRPTYETKRLISNHIFDGAGENIHYHSDSESVASRKSKTRFVNPAICIEKVSSSSTSLNTAESEMTSHPHTYRSTSSPYLTGRVSNASSTSIQRKSCRLGSGEMDEDKTPRCEECHGGADTFRLSVASVSTTATAREEREKNEKRRQETFQKWLERKEQEVCVARLLSKEKREKARHEKTRPPDAPTITPEQREESYRRWLERKQAQIERRKAEEILQRMKEKERMERERKSRENKEEKLTEWIKRKEGEMKLMKTRAERRAARASIEEERRRVQGERAYRDWLRASRGKPLPVPLNRGELSMRGSVSQMYINPIPWQSLT